MADVIPMTQPTEPDIANVEAEMALLGACLTDSAIAADLPCTPDDFSFPLHSRIFDAIRSAAWQGKRTGALLLRPQFEQDPDIPTVGGISYLAKLLNHDLGLLPPELVAEQIADLGARRRMLTAIADAQAQLLDTREDGPTAAEIIANALVPVAKPRAKELPVVDAFDFNERDIPTRPWIIPGAILRGYTHMLAAPGGSGKSLFTLQLAIALAKGDQWGEFKPRKRYRSMLTNVEDDIDEQRRRLAAASRVMGDCHDLRGMIHLVDTTEGIVVAQASETEKSIVTSPVVDTLRRYVMDNDIDVLFVDPFAETFEGDENDNSQVKWAMRIWRDEIARACNCAVYLVHHTTKHAQNGAGDANVIRGAGAIVNSTRISATLMPMTTEDANAIGIDPNERHLFVRYDDAKANQSLKVSGAKWFRKETVELDNAGEDCPADFVGALVPWNPPDVFDGLSFHVACTVLDQIDAGRDNGERYTASTKGGTKASGRWAGSLLIDLAGLNEAQAKKVISTWIKNGVLVEDEYHDPVYRKPKTGLFAPENMRPRQPE